MPPAPDSAFHLQLNGPPPKKRPANCSSDSRPSTAGQSKLLEHTDVCVMEPNLKNVLVTGGAGYVGHVLTPRLLAEGYNVTVYDQLFFGCRLPNNPNLRVVQGDIRDTAKIAEALAGQDAVLHLACISNDASFE